MYRRICSPVSQQRSGAVAVEAACVLPFFLMVLWGIVEFGRAMMVGQLVTNASRYGARLAILDGSTNTAVTSEVRQFLVQTIGGVSQGDIGVQIEVTPAAGHPDPGHQLAATRTNDMCRIIVSVPYQKVGYVSGSFLATANLRAACAMRHE